MNLHSVPVALCSLCVSVATGLVFADAPFSPLGAEGRKEVKAGSLYAPLPSAQWVLDRYAEVSGQRAHLPQHTSITIRGRYQDPANKIEASTISYTTKDGVTLQSYRLSDGRSGANGYDGHIGWTLGLSGQPVIQTGDIARSMARDADMYYHLHVQRYFKQMDVVGFEEFHGHTCYHLKGVNNWNEPNEQFYDKSSGLLIGYKFNTAWRGGNGDADNIFEEYKPFDGILFATKETDHDGKDMTLSFIDSVTFDDVKPSDLDPPAAVKTKLTETGNH